MDFSPEQVTKLTLLRPQAGKEQELVDAMKKYAADVQANDPNTLSWHIIEIMEPAEDGGKEFAVLERYKDEASAKAHYETSYFQEMKAKASILRSPISTRNTAAIGGFMMRK